MNDTETLIALVASLLPQTDKHKSHDSILSALVESDGDPEAAVKFLLQENSKTIPSRNFATNSKKRKRAANLDTWLKSPSASKNQATEREITPSSPSPLTAPQLTGPLKFNSKKLKSSDSKPFVNLMSILRRPETSSSRTVPPRMPPLTLATPELVAEHTPCTLHLSVLPPELACRLFYTMMDASKTWKKNKWWLFDRVVESPHLTSFFSRKTNGLDNNEDWQQAAQYWYNGRMTEPPSTFPPEMEEACEIVEEIVNAEIRKRGKRYKHEWKAGDGDPLWRANVAASNCYRGGQESVGFHSDQLTYLGPYPTIASLSLGTRRIFSMREVVSKSESSVRRARTFNLPLPHNSLTIMHASCQERFKHTIPPQSAVDLYRPLYPRSPGEPIEPSTCRINITFRFYRPDFRPESIPRCHCGVPTVLRPDMKNRNEEETDKYWWTCYAGAQNDGKGCNFWKVMNLEEEGRGAAH